MDFNGLHVILILCRFLINCHRFGIDSLGFKHSTSKCHGFWCDFEKLKIHDKSKISIISWNPKKSISIWIPSDFNYLFINIQNGVSAHIHMQWPVHSLIWIILNDLDHTKYFSFILIIIYSSINWITITMNELDLIIFFILLF